MNKKFSTRMKRLLAGVTTLLLISGGVTLGMNGYTIPWWTIDGGGGTSEGEQYKVTGTLGQPDSGSMAGGSYQVSGGFWQAGSAIQAVGLNSGWNMISSYMSPNPAAMAEIFPPPGGDLVICKDGAGLVYWPDLGINQIGNWNPAHGYQCYTDGPFSISISGTKIPTGSPMPLPSGWSLTAYWRDVPLAAEAALATCSAELLLAKNGSGEVYWPAFNINQIGDMQPGQGYQLFLDAPCTLTYPDS